MLHMTLGVVCIGHVSRQVVELYRADGTDAMAESRGRFAVGGGCGMACGRLEGGQTRGEGDVEEGCGG